VSEIRVEAARIAWDGHLTEHDCTTLDCATAQLRWQLYLAALREEHEAGKLGRSGQPGAQLARNARPR
jgi:hypothetical protein